MDKLRKFAKEGFNRMKHDYKKSNSKSTGSCMNNPCLSLPSLSTKEKNATELETDFKERKFSYTWRVKNMHLCTLKTGKFLQSPPFSTRFCGEIAWSLKIYPKGREFPETDKLNRKDSDLEELLNFADGTHDHCQYFGLFLYRISNCAVNTSVRYRLACEVCLSPKTEIGRSYPHKFCRFNYPSEQDLELIDLNLAEVSEYGTDYLFCQHDIGNLEMDSFDIRCEINIISAFNMGVTSNYIAGATLIHDLEEMLETGNFSDVTLESKGVKFRAHKNILASRSQYFAAMFQHDMQEARSNVVQFEDIEPEALRGLLQYIYTGRVEDFDVEKAMSLYAASDKYLMKELKKWCTDIMLRDLTVENVCRVVVLANMHPGQELKDAALYMFRSYTSEIFNREEWNYLVKDPNHSDLVSEILIYVSSDFITDCGNK